MKEYKIGDTFWTYNLNSEQKIIKCPACLGTCKVLVKPFNGKDEDGSIIECEYCKGKGRKDEGYDYILSIVQRTITGLNIRENFTEYIYDNYTLKEDMVFETKEEAENKGDKALREIVLRGEANDLSYGQKYYKCGWNVGYHKQQIADLRQKVEYHRIKLNLPPEEFDMWLEEMNRIVPRRKSKNE